MYNHKNSLSAHKIFQHSSSELEKLSIFLAPKKVAPKKKFSSLLRHFLEIKLVKGFFLVHSPTFVEKLPSMVLLNDGSLDILWLSVEEFLLHLRMILLHCLYCDRNSQRNSREKFLPFADGDSKTFFSRDFFPLYISSGILNVLLCVRDSQSLDEGVFWFYQKKYLTSK